MSDVRVLSAISLVLAMTVPRVALGALPASVTLESTGGPVRRLSDFAGKVVVLIYEDRESAQQNAALKRELAERAQRADRSRNVVLLPVADLHAYDFWPAHGFARKAVVDAAAKAGIEILMDWEGSTARALKLHPKQSQVLVFDAAGSELFRSSGTLSDAERSRFFAVLERALGRES